MSLVLGYCDGKNAIIASDGKAGGTVCPSENYNKTRRINKNIILGFVGYKETCEYFIKLAYLEMGNDVENYFFEDFLEIVEFAMGLDEVRKKLLSTFLIIGKTKTGELKFIMAGQSTNFEIRYISGNEVNLAFIGGTVPPSTIKEVCNRNIAAASGNIINIMIKIIEDVAALDDSVNTNCYFTLL